MPLTYLGIISNNWESVLASGGFGTVYKGVDMNANLEVAIKTLRSDRMSEKDKLDFEEEMMVGYPRSKLMILLVKALTTNVRPSRRYQS